DESAGESAGDEEPTPDVEPSKKKRVTQSKKKTKKKPDDEDAEPTSLPARPSKAAINKGISGVSGAVSSCKTKGWFPGQTIKVKIVVAPSGKVTSASARGPIAGTPLARCIEKAVRGANFGKSEKGTDFLHEFRG
ncbi:MAG: hypothetical protein KC468_04510, partial [Myxococcales bacterium]|nr:hypothetical protein [Myxococcales bacterium]